MQLRGLGRQCGHSLLLHALKRAAFDKQAKYSRNSHHKYHYPCRNAEHHGAVRADDQCHVEYLVAPVGSVKWTRLRIPASGYVQEVVYRVAMFACRFFA